MKKAFVMKLYPGMEEEYERRHRALWPRLKESIHRFGGSNYTIWLDKKTHLLFGTIEIEDEARWAAQADDPVNREWWDYMAPLMETNPDNSPVSRDLHEVFHLD